MRGSYARYVREVKNRPSGSAASKKKKWYLADSMSFMHSFVGQHRKSKGNIENQDEVEEGMPLSTFLEDVNEMTEEANETVEGISSCTMSTSQASETHGKAENRSDSNPETSKKRKMSTSDMVAGSMVEFKKKRSQPTPPANPNLKFFESLIPDVEKLSSKRIRLFKYKVMGFLNDLLDDQENEESAKSSAPSPYACTPSPYASTPSPYASSQHACTTTPTPPQRFPSETERSGSSYINTGNSNCWNTLPSNYNNQPSAFQ